MAALLRRRWRTGSGSGAALLLALAASGLGAQAPLPGSSASVQARDPGPLFRRAYLMGTWLEIGIPGHSGRAAALAASEGVVRRVAAMEDLLSTWDEGTSLSRLNRASVDAAVPLPSEVGPLVEEALAWSRRTGRAFDPRVGALVDAWDLRGAGRTPEPGELNRALAAAGPSGITVDDGRWVRRSPEAWLDAGGFGKGAALRDARASLDSAGIQGARINFGGQLLLLGDEAAGAPGWSVPVAHPTHRHRPVAHLRVRDASVATSGTSERPGHLLDPRTGRPVTPWGGVTVVARDPLVADVLSTALFVLGPRDGLRLLEGHPEVGALFLIPSDRGLEACWNDAMARWLHTPPAALPCTTIHEQTGRPAPMP